LIFMETFCLLGYYIFPPLCLFGCLQREKELLKAKAIPYTLPRQHMLVSAAEGHLPTREAKARTLTTDPNRHLPPLCLRCHYGWVCSLRCSRLIARPQATETKSHHCYRVFTSFCTWSYSLLLVIMIACHRSAVIATCIAG